MVAEQLYRACPPERVARRLSERLQNALDQLASSMSQYNSGRTSSQNDSADTSQCSPYPARQTEFTSHLIDRMNTLLRNLSELTETGDPEPPPKQLAAQFFELIDLYHSQFAPDSGR